MSLGIAALSLLGPRALAFDPAAWLVWGEQLADMRLDTTAGPSWKPLPVAFTAPLAFTGDAAPTLWLLVARTGAVLALFGVAALALQFAGRAAATCAGLLVLVSPWWWYNAVLGNSEGILAAAISWGAVAHFAGYRRLAMASGLVAATVRPEVAVFFSAYCVFVAVNSPAHRLFAMGSMGIALAAWLGPDLAGAGGALRSAESSRGWASPASARNADVPALAVVVNAVRQLSLPATLAAAAAVALARGRASRRREMTLAVLALTYIGLVVALTAAGYAGNPRYAVPAIALLTTLAAVGAVRLGVRLAGGDDRSVASAIAAAVLVLAVAAVNAGGLREAAADVSARAAWGTALVHAIAQAGGPEVLRGCGQVRTAGPWRALVAYRLDLPLWRVTSRPGARGIVLVPPEPPTPRPAAEDRRLLATVGGWEVWEACGRPAPTSPPVPGQSSSS